MEEYLDVVDENGNPTGETVARSVAHRKGIRHRTSHVWICRKKHSENQGTLPSESSKSKAEGNDNLNLISTMESSFGRNMGKGLREAGNSAADIEILLQKRSEVKDSFPGCYDISSAGHIPAGSSFVPSALRELKEELGVDASPDDLIFCGLRHFEFQKVFHEKPFHDRQVSAVFLLWLDREPEDFTLQKEEISEVRWMDFTECVNAVREQSIPNCIDLEELELIQRYFC